MRRPGPGRPLLCHGEASALIEGHIEAVSSDGVVQGWLRDSTASDPCHVQILLNRQVVAESLAALFRQDLLMGGHGHGHHGFGARLRVALPEGRCSLMLHLPSSGINAPMSVFVPPLDPPQRTQVEALLQARPGWTADLLLARPACLGLAAQHEIQGTARLVDSMFHFVLGRWPSPAEARLHAAGLQTGRIGPEDLLTDLLASRERAETDWPLPSPYDPEFPFGPGAR